MVEKFFPNEVVDGVKDINLDSLAEKRIKGLILDVDNTLAPKFRTEADNEIVLWIEKAKNKGFKLCIVSNASKERVEKFNDKLGLIAIYRAVKPWKRSYKRALKMLNLKAYETAAIGDQIFTDVYGGNRLGIYTIFVKPIHKEKSLFNRLKRKFEGYIFDRYYKTN